MIDALLWALVCFLNYFGNFFKKIVLVWDKTMIATHDLQFDSTNWRPEYMGSNVEMF